jgi:serine/threonine-protein kinase
MALAIGARLGPYEIASRLGAGGMGEVYRGTDTNLGRPVAIKVLPDVFAQNPDRLARFEREARTLASLNHPNIAIVHGLERGSAGETGHGVRALVMELVEGPTLADRIGRGALPLAEVLPLARQIADALEAAHEAGVVHRDLKPANIKVRPDGVVKVLDFGLAKLDRSDPGAPHSSESPTMAVPAETEAGVVLGTAPYMSPEQAIGKDVDKRTDIWAFGCVLYEMLTGSVPFTGDTKAHTLAAILEREPDWSALPPATPLSLRRLLERCLTKDPKRRLRDIGDARVDLVEESPRSAQVETGNVGRRTAWGVPQIAMVILAAVGAGALAWSLKPGASAASVHVTRLVITPPEDEPIATDRAAVAVSPDGRRVAYVTGRGTRRRIYMRDLQQFDSVPLPGTEGGDSPFFSPDGQWLGFLAGGRMKKVRLTGGPPQTVTLPVQTNAGFSSARWERDDFIYFTPALRYGIWRVSAEGGTPTEVTRLTQTESTHRWSQLLPGGKTLLFSASTASSFQLVAQALETGQRTALGEGQGSWYLPTGHLVYVQASALMAVPFNPARLERTGSPVAVLSGFRQLVRLRNSSVANQLPQISFSEAGTLAYAPASPRPPQHALVWVTRAGVEQPTGASGGVYFQPRVSPDGGRLAVTVSGEEHDDVWTYDLSRGGWGRVTLEGNNAFPLWTPDGGITFVSDKAGPDSIYWKALDSSLSEERLTTSEVGTYPFAWSQNDELLFVVGSPITLQNISLLRRGEKGGPTSWLETQFAEGGPALSPDGRWVAYVSNESGRNEIYVRPFHGSGEKATISTEGGNEPVWSPDGRELFYRNGDAMMAIDVPAGNVLVAGKPRLLFERRYEPSASLWPNYSVTRDGQRFLMVKAIDDGAASTQINVVVNWFEELKRSVPR